MLDLTDRVFGRLTITGRSHKDKNNNWLWNASCICGRTTTCYSFNLKSGATISCGCWLVETAQVVAEGNVRHGHARRGQHTPTYVTWKNMTQRCSNPNNPKWELYGGRGIAVCDAWSDYKHFLADKGERPEGTTIDRFPDKNGDYTPSNTRWATPTQQAHNTRGRSS